MTEDEVIDLVWDAGLDWHQGFPVGEETNRYETLVSLVEVKLMERLLAGAGEPTAYLQPKCVDSFMRADLGYETCSSSDYGAFSVYTADQVAAEALRYEQDAERYRWLRSLHWEQDVLGVVVRPKTHTKLGCLIPSEALLDETIDNIRARGNT